MFAREAYYADILDQNEWSQQLCADDNTNKINDSRTAIVDIFSTYPVKA